MWIRSDRAVVYDIEIFPNVFHTVLYDTELKMKICLEISERKNDIEELIRLFTEKDNKIFVGYNNHHYDDVIINYIIDYKDKLTDLPYWRICQSLFNLSSYIVKDEE